MLFIIKQLNATSAVKNFIGDCHPHSKCYPKWSVCFYRVLQNGFLDRGGYPTAPVLPVILPASMALLAFSFPVEVTPAHKSIPKLAQVWVISARLVWFDSSGGGTRLWEHLNNPALFPRSHFHHPRCTDISWQLPRPACQWMPSNECECSIQHPGIIFDDIHFWL